MHTINLTLPLERELGKQIYQALHGRLGVHLLISVFIN